MSIEIIQEAKREEVVERFICFDQRDMPEGTGYSFRCDEEGNLIDDENWSERRGRIYALLCNKGYKFPVIREYRWNRLLPRIGKCVCGEEVCLTGYPNDCECGRDYDIQGNLLAPRSQWGEETGESIGDILQADADYEQWRWHADY